MKFSNQSVLLAVLVLVLSVLALALWLPNDTVSGYLQSRRGRTTIGDAMAPGFAFSLMALSGVLILIQSRHDPRQSINRHHVFFVVMLLGLFALCFSVMRFAGPAITAMFTEPGGYRVLRDTVPWKYVGFVLGGGGLIATLVSYMDHRLSIKAVLIGLIATLALIGVFDLAFDNLLLPPNGDV